MKITKTERIFTTENKIKATLFWKEKLHKIRTTLYAQIKIIDDVYQKMNIILGA